MTRIVNGLTKHYGFKRESEDIRYWTLHMGVDEEHMKVGPLAVERYAVTEPQQATVRSFGAKNSRSVLARFRRHQTRVRRQRSAFTRAGATESNEGVDMEMVDLSRLIYDGMPKIPMLAGCSRAKVFESRKGPSVKRHGVVVAMSCRHPR